MRGGTLQEGGPLLGVGNGSCCIKVYEGLIRGFPCCLNNNVLTSFLARDNAIIGTDVRLSSGLVQRVARKFASGELGPAERPGGARRRMSPC